MCSKTDAEARLPCLSKQKCQDLSDTVSSTAHASCLNSEIMSKTFLKCSFQCNTNERMVFKLATNSISLLLSNNPDLRGKC